MASTFTSDAPTATGKQPSYSPAPLNYKGAATAGQTPTPPPGYNLLSQIYQSQLPQVNAQVAGYDQNIANLQQQLGLTQANQQTQTGYLNQSQQNQLASLGLSNQANDINVAANQRAQALLPQQNALQNQLYGLNNQAIQQNITQGQQLHGLNLADLAQQNQALTRNYNNTLQNLQGQAAAQGAVNSMGYGRNVGLTGANYNDQMNSLLRQGQSENIGYTGSQADLQRQLQQQGINQQQYGLNYNEQVQQAKDQEKNLALVAKQNNLSKEEVLQRTQQALGQLGLSTIVNSGQILQAMVDAQNGKISAYTSLLAPIYQAIGLFPLNGG